MLPRPLRLTRSADIRRVVTTGRRFNSPYFTVYYLSSDQSPLQSAVVVGKRVHKSAVTRHRYQRWFRALIHQALADLPATGSLVIVGRPALAQLQRQDQLQSHWQAFMNWSRDVLS